MKKGLALALIYRWYLGPSNVLTDSSVLICLGVLATGQSNDVIADWSFGTHQFQPQKLEIKDISVNLREGWRLKISKNNWTLTAWVSFPDRQYSVYTFILYGWSRGLKFPCLNLFQILSYASSPLVGPNLYSCAVTKL